MLETSIIIRTKNEGKWIGENLKRLIDQTYKNFEIIIVDSGSTDRTLDIVNQFSNLLNIRIFKIKPEDFSYPFALNYGVRQSLAEKYLVFLSGHSLPISKTWLEDGIKNFTNDKIMGAYGFVWALPDGSIWEKLIFNKYLCKIRNIFKKQIIIDRAGMGVLGFTNAIIKKDLWKQRNFNEKYGFGGEDGEWANYWFNKGYKAARDIKFSAYHSHGLDYGQLKQQWMYWHSLNKPRPFKPLDFRKK